MKAIGIVRKIDDLGRVVLPMELRKSMGIDNKDPLEIFIDGESIVLKKYKPSMVCHVTGEVTDENIVLAGGKLVLSLSAAKQLQEELNAGGNN